VRPVTTVDSSMVNLYSFYGTGKLLSTIHQEIREVKIQGEVFFLKEKVSFGTMPHDFPHT
jgi:hypothetical protein